jgi:hypothetical protein
MADMRQDAVQRLDAVVARVAVARGGWHGAAGHQYEHSKDAIPPHGTPLIAGAMNLG